MKLSPKPKRRLRRRSVSGKMPTQRFPFFKRLIQGMSCVFVFLAVGYLVFWCLDPAHFPISSVRFIGEREYLAQEELRTAISSELQKGFLRLKVSRLQRQLLSLPWVKAVEIRKVWPNQLVVRFEEHEPAARWGDKGLLSTEGKLFYPERSQLEVVILPVLQGPEGRSTEVWQQYLVMKKTLEPLNLAVTQMVLASRGAWHVRLSNDITVVLGTNDIMKRWQRFISAYEKHFNARQQEIAYVDLRYTNGMAIGWRAG